MLDLLDQFWTAWTSPDAPTPSARELLPSRLAWACTQVLPVAGAGISAFSREFRVPLGCSDDTAQRAERLQFTIGEGPCLDAHGGTDEVRSNEAQIEQRWPLMHEVLSRHTPYRSIVSVPLSLSGDTTGALDLYLIEPTLDEAGDLTSAGVIADTIVAILDLTGTGMFSSGRPGPDWLYGPGSEYRMRLWVAMGLLTARHDLPAADALAVLRGYSYSHDRLLDDVADAVVRGTVSTAELQP
ncbi:MAG: ANTAR domain-containing protein [bacterium]